MRGRYWESEERAVKELDILEDNNLESQHAFIFDLTRTFTGTTNTHTQRVSRLGRRGQGTPSISEGLTCWEIVTTSVELLSLLRLSAK